MATTKIIVGLGNPGREYARTRHNLGFLAVERLASEMGAVFGECRYAQALCAEIRTGAERTMMVLPQTFMNNSGNAVRDIVKFDNVALEDILIVCDDIRLDPGKLRLRLEGSDAGHNGLASVASGLGTEGYARLRLGIGAPPAADVQKDFVLGVFTPAETKMLAGILESACDCCRLWLTGDTARAMTLYNKRKDDE